MKTMLSGYLLVCGLLCCLLLAMPVGPARAEASGLSSENPDNGQDWYRDRQQSWHRGWGGGGTSARKGERGNRGSLGLHLGGQASYRRTEVAWHAPALWENEGLDNRPLAITLEAALAHWHAVGGRRPVNLWQASLIPLLQWHFHPDYYLELGIGLTLISRTRFANKRMATAFQFGDHAGVGLRLGNGDRLGLRLSHFSNASLKTPNPGLNVWQVIYHHHL